MVGSNHCTADIHTNFGRGKLVAGKKTLRLPPPQPVTGSTSNSATTSPFEWLTASSQTTTSLSIFTPPPQPSPTKSSRSKTASSKPSSRSLTPTSKSPASFFTPLTRRFSRWPTPQPAFVYPASSASSEDIASKRRFTRHLIVDTSKYRHYPLPSLVPVRPQRHSRLPSRQLHCNHRPHRTIDKKTSDHRRRPRRNRPGNPIPH